MNKSLFLLLLICCCVSGCAYLGYLKDPFTNIPNFSRVDEVLLRGGKPNPQGIEELKAMGVKTIVSLCGQGEETDKEKKLAENSGMGFFSIPLSVYSRPEQNQVMEFLEIVLNKDNQPLFVHCTSGRDRTGAMVALYRVTVSGWTPKQAYNEALSKGFWPYRGTAELKKFILQIKDYPLYFEKARELKNEKKP